MRQSLKRLAVGLVVLAFVAIVLFPGFARWLSLPHSSMRLDRALDDMQRIGQAITDFEKQQGQRPASIGELRKFVERSRQDEQTRLAVHRRGWQYYPDAVKDEPVGACVLFYESKNVLVTVNSDCSVHASRIWLWPTWRMRDREDQ